MNIFEDTILEVVNLDLSKLGIEFLELWDLKMNSKGGGYVTKLISMYILPYFQLFLHQM
jgi:hypothetical protein